MATGYDTRQVTRQSFGTQPSAPAQTRSTYQGASRVPQIEGGNAEGGVSASPMTTPGPIAGQLGAYFEQQMQPYIQRKQEEALYKGFHAAQSGIALKEISHPDNPITKIFGPTGYERGAEMYAAQTAVSSWQAAHMADMDNLIKLSPDDLAKHLADTSTKAMTGDPFADQIVQKGLIDATGPLMNTIVKTREAKQQVDAIGSAHASLLSAGDALQAVVSQQTKLGAQDPDEGGQSAIQASMRTFTGLLGKPMGMTDDSYHKLLYGTARDAMQTGNGYAVAAMKRAGAWSVLTPDEQDKLDENYQKFGKRANADATAQYTDELIRHDALVARGDLTPVEAAQALDAINLKIKRSTGFDVDVFDADAIRSDAHTVTSAVIAADRKREERAWEQHLRKEDWDHDEQMQKDKEDRQAAAAQITWKAGSPVQAIMGGVDKDLVEAQASNDWFKGDMTNIVRTFNQGYQSTAVQNAAQSSMRAVVGEQYSKAFEQEHQRWAKLAAAKPAAAYAYYGEYNVMMQRFDGLTKQGTDPVTAYASTFGNPEQYGTADIDPSRRKEVNDAMQAVIDSQTWQAHWNITGRTNLGPLGNRVVMQTAHNHVGVAGRNSPISTQQLMSEAIGAATASGEFERYGQFAWRNKAGTRPIGQMLGLREKDADAVFTNVYNRHAVRIGAAANVDPIAPPLRVDNNGHPAVVATIPGRDGHPHRIVLTYDELAKEAHDYVGSKVARAPVIRPVDPTMRPGGMK